MTDPVVTLSRRKIANMTAITPTYTNHSRISLCQLTVLDESQAISLLFHV